MENIRIDTPLFTSFPGSLFYKPLLGGVGRVGNERPCQERERGRRNSENLENGAKTVVAGVQYISYLSPPDFNQYF